MGYYRYQIQEKPETYRELENILGLNLIKNVRDLSAFNKIARFFEKTMVKGYCS